MEVGEREDCGFREVNLFPYGVECARSLNVIPKVLQVRRRYFRTGMRGVFLIIGSWKVNMELVKGGRCEDVLNTHTHIPFTYTTIRSSLNFSREFFG